MNDDQFEGLDDRAKTAASSAQAAAQRRPRPAFDADRPTTMPAPAAVGQSRAPRRTAWVAAAAVVALIAGAVTFAVTRPDDGKDTIVASSVEDPRPFVADTLPDGLGPMAFMNLETDPSSSFSSSMPIYGKTPEEPLAGATVIEPRVFDELELTSSEVDGMTVYRRKGENFLPGQWVGVKQGEAFILVFGATEGDAISLARIVSVADGNVSVDNAALPEGWRRLVTVESPLELMGMSVRGGSTGYMASYMSENADISVQIASLAGTEASMWAGRLFVPDSREVMVRGHRGFVGSYPMNDVSGDTSGDPAPRVTVVGWVERPGEVLGMIGIDVSEDELLALAEGIRPAADQEWADLVRQSKLGEFDGNPGSGIELGRTTGTFADGTGWALTVRSDSPPDGPPGDGPGGRGVFTELRVAVPADGGSANERSGSSSSGGDGAFRSLETTDTGGRYFSSGILGNDVARVQLRRSDDSVLTDAPIMEVAGYRVFVTELTEDPTVLVALRDDGSEAGRVTIEDLGGNSTVSIDGEGFTDSGGAQSSTFEGQGTSVDGGGKPIPDSVQPTPTTAVAGN